MSITDLTRNAYASGIIPDKWANLCKLFVVKHHAQDTPEAVGMAICNSVLILYPLYNGDITLRMYLVAAMDNGLVPIYTFVQTFLQAVQSPQLQHPAYWDSLCSAAVESYRKTGAAPAGVLTQANQGSAVTFATIHDALSLLNHVYALNLPVAKTQSVSDLFALLLSCINVPDLAQIPAPQILSEYSAVLHLSQSPQVPTNMREMLDAFSLDLRMAMPSHAASSSEMLPVPQITIPVVDMSRPIPDNDLVVCGLLLRQLVDRRGSREGCCNSVHAARMLSAFFIWTAWKLPEFFRQLLLAVFTCVADGAQAGEQPFQLWKGFAIARLPGILHSVRASVNDSEHAVRTAMQNAMTSIVQSGDVLIRCNQFFRNGEVQSDPNRFTNPFLAQMINNGLLDMQLWDLPGLTQGLNGVHKEAEAAGVSLDDYMSTQLSNQHSVEEVKTLVSSVVADYLAHASFAKALLARLDALISNNDVENLGAICQVLYTDDAALDMLSLHICLDDVIERTASQYRFDLTSAMDPQTAVVHIGYIVMYIQTAVVRFKLSVSPLSDRLAALNPSSSGIGPLPEDSGTYQVWNVCLFDPRSEGIEDAIFRSTKPLSLLRIAPSLILEAVDRCATGVMPKPVLMNGTSYFLGPLLSWTLFGVVKELLSHIQRSGFKSLLHLEVLQTLLLADTTPTPILRLSAPFILRTFTETVSTRLAARPLTSFDINPVRKKVLAAVGLSRIIANDANSAPERATVPQGTKPAGEAPPQARTLIQFNKPSPWVDQAALAIRHAISQAGSGQVPVLDVPRCIMSTTPTGFLHTLWRELLASTLINGPAQVAPRLAVVVLTAPRVHLSPGITTCLLPLFLQLALPRIVLNIDDQEPQDANSLELLAVIIPSALTAALCLERASVTEKNNPTRNTSAMAMSRDLARWLQSQRAKSATCKALLQRLAAMSSFRTQFPVFAR